MKVKLGSQLCKDAQRQGMAKARAQAKARKHSSPKQNIETDSDCKAPRLLHGLQPLQAPEKQRVQRNEEKKQPEVQIVCTG